MRITYKGDYAIKTILDLALHNPDSPLAIYDLAKRLDIPAKFLEQILLDLKRGGFVESRRGKGGGYLLGRPAAQIKLGEVIRFIDGPIEPIACVDNDYNGCRDMNKCALRDVWMRVSKITADIVDSITFADLVKKTRTAGTSFAYQI